MYMPYRKKKFFANPHPQSFVIFVYEFQRNEAKRIGHIVSLKEAYAGGAVAWKALPQSEKDRYERVAASPTWKEYKAKYQSYSYGLTFSELEEIENKREHEEKSMLRDIDLIIDAAKRNDSIAEQKLHFIMANYFVKLNDSDETYVPAEISLCEFSLRDGVLNSFHSFVNPGVLPFGHALQAQEHAKATHQLELPPNAVGEDNLGRLYSLIVKFISSTNEDDKKQCNRSTNLPPVFTDENSVRIIKSILKFCKNDCFDEYVPNIRVFPLQNIFYKMKLAASYIGDTEAPKSIDETNESLLQDNYDYETSLSCKFHENLDCGKFCPLSTVTRWCYTFSENICPDLAIKLLPGQHMPSQCDYILKSSDNIEMKPMPIREPKHCYNNNNIRRDKKLKYKKISPENTSFRYSNEIESKHLRKSPFPTFREKKIKGEKLESEYECTDNRYECDSDIQSIKSLNKSIVSIDSDSEYEDASKDRKSFEKIDKKEKRYKKEFEYSESSRSSYIKLFPIQKAESRRTRSNSDKKINDEERKYFKSLNRDEKFSGSSRRSSSVSSNKRRYRKSKSRTSMERYLKRKSEYEKQKKYSKTKTYSRASPRPKITSRSPSKSTAKLRSTSPSRTRPKLRSPSRTRPKSRSPSRTRPKSRSPLSESYKRDFRDEMFSRVDTESLLYPKNHSQKFRSRSRTRTFRSRSGSRTRPRSRSPSRSKIRPRSRSTSRSRTKPTSISPLSEYRRNDSKNEMYCRIESESSLYPKNQSSQFGYYPNSSSYYTYINPRSDISSYPEYRFSNTVSTPHKFSPSFHSYHYSRPTGQLRESIWSKLFSK